MSIKFLVLGGGGYFGFGGGKCRFYFYGRGDFSGSGRFLRIWRCGFANVRQTSPSFTKIRMSARALLVRPRTCLSEDKGESSSHPPP